MTEFFAQCFICKETKDISRHHCTKCNLGFCQTCAIEYNKKADLTQPNVIVLRETYYGLDLQWDLSTVLCNKCEPTAISVEQDSFVLPKISVPKQSNVLPLSLSQLEWRALQTNVGIANISFGV